MTQAGQILEQMQAKKPWEMTRAEYVPQAVSKSIGPGKYSARRPVGAYSKQLESAKIQVAMDIRERNFDALEYVKRRADKQVVHDAAIILLKQGGREGQLVKNLRAIIKMAKKTGVVRTAERHKLLVKQAIRKGKPVPPQVLAEYPDLGKRY